MKTVKNLLENRHRALRDRHRKITQQCHQTAKQPDIAALPDRQRIEQSSREQLVRIFAVRIMLAPWYFRHIGMARVQKRATAAGNHRRVIGGCNFVLAAAPIAFVVMRIPGDIEAAFSVIQFTRVTFDETWFQAKATGKS